MPHEFENPQQVAEVLLGLAQFVGYEDHRDQLLVWLGNVFRTAGLSVQSVARVSADKRLIVSRSAQPPLQLPELPFAVAEPESASLSESVECRKWREPVRCLSDGTLLHLLGATPEIAAYAHFAIRFGFG